MLNPYDLMEDGEVQVGTSFNTDGSSEPVLQKIGTLFDSRFGWHGMYYPGSGDYSETALIIAGFADGDDRSMDLFHAIEPVAILPNPVFDAAKPLSEHVDAPGYRFTSEHLDCLVSWANLGFVPSDTVVDLCRKAQVLNPLFDLQLSRF